MREECITWKNSCVEPPFLHPYCMTVCLAKSSTFEIAGAIRDRVREAAKLAVYEDIMIRVKNQQILAKVRVESALNSDEKIN